MADLRSLIEYILERRSRTIAAGHASRAVLLAVNIGVRGEELANNKRGSYRPPMNQSRRK
jgi:hypothetical protein